MWAYRFRGGNLTWLSPSLSESNPIVGGLGLNINKLSGFALYI